ncbi:sulfurtransferase [Rufibacter sp. DG15C]|uniref:MBL fold metallo-hydrolase n=1 Tax=Rufibacter sp. DG15C TaxID=1379909 RepID=UPI00078C5981|nr:MBL fold metallo-hydrolase [Rufibacter sp. DG15C]AMM50793.1 sulfurtransferase [Rufibacter sp. DG15C]
MKIEQFEDKGLAHYSYIIMSDAEIAVIDPTRDPKQYEEYAMLHDARITTIIETHPHADFVSGHLELAEAKNATIYVSELLGAEYKHTTFDDGDVIKLGKVTLKAINTPGHSPDSISILLLDEEGKEHAVFTGDTLFIGDVGRPDLRENVGNLTASREELARQMYHSTREKLMTLPDDVLVYPAHGAGSLCGKGMSSANSSTIGDEKRTNPALQPMSEDAFVQYLTSDQPFVPKYFEHAVAINRKGAPKYESSVKRVPVLPADHELEKNALVIDTRPQAQFKKGHLPNSINLQDGGKFETWLGSIVWPTEQFYLVVENEAKVQEIISKTARIGYNRLILGALTCPPEATDKTPELNLEDFKQHPENYTIVDVRNWNEIKQRKIFPSALEIPLPELRERVEEVPADKPVIIHCAAGYRSAAATSIVKPHVVGVPVYDLGDAISQF